MANFIDISAIAVKIPSGTAISNILMGNGNPAAKLQGYFGDALLIQFFGPPVLDAAHVYNFEVTYDVTPVVGGNWLTWNNGTANIVAPGAGISIGFIPPAANGLRIRDITGNVAADRIWQVLKAFNVY